MDIELALLVAIFELHKDTTSTLYDRIGGRSGLLKLLRHHRRQTRVDIYFKRLPTFKASF